MIKDIRNDSAKYYDIGRRDPPNDIPFYKDLIPSPNVSILELGCGTGRVTIPLSENCKFIYGIDISPTMLDICRQKINDLNIPKTKLQIAVGDITKFKLDRKYDFIIAPYRVLQNIEKDEDVDGLFHCIRKHLAPKGTCILNVFKPFRPPELLCKEWVNNRETFCWEAPYKNGKVVCYDCRSRMDKENLILYPDLIYRYYENEKLQEEIVLNIVMRCYYPDTFENLILKHNFKIVNKWGGYQGETYGQGNELVIQFCEK